MADCAETLVPPCESVGINSDVTESSCANDYHLRTKPLDRHLSSGRTEVDEYASVPMMLDEMAQIAPDEVKNAWISGNGSKIDVHKPMPSPIPSVPSSWYEDAHDQSYMVGAGLSNLGKTCFFNAVMQCFTHSVLLVQGLYSCTLPTPCDCKNERFCLLCAFREQIEVLVTSTGKVVSPWKLVYNLSYFSSSFRTYQQQDAHEFMQCFLDRLESSFNNLKVKDVAFSSQNNTLVKQVFGGLLISKLRCCNCNHISDKYESSVGLSLEIDDASSLLTALELFTRVERIEDEEMKFICDNCEKKMCADKQLMLDQSPPICAFHLKRFKNDGSFVQKIDKHVEFPLELDLQPYTCGKQSNNVDLKYEVYAVIVHAGYTSTCGHYYCYIRSARETWYKYDDSKVTSVSEANVLSEEAYILFYARKGTPWFSNFMETFKPSSMYPSLSNTAAKLVLDAKNIELCSTSTKVTVTVPEIKDLCSTKSDAVAPNTTHHVKKVIPPLTPNKYSSIHKIPTVNYESDPNRRKTISEIKENLSPSTPPTSSALHSSDYEPQRPKMSSTSMKDQLEKAKSVARELTSRRTFTIRNPVPGLSQPLGSSRAPVRNKDKIVHKSYTILSTLNTSIAGWRKYIHATLLIICFISIAIATGFRKELKRYTLIDIEMWEWIIFGTMLVFGKSISFWVTRGGIIVLEGIHFLKGYVLFIYSLRLSVEFLIWSILCLTIWGTLMHPKLSNKKFSFNFVTKLFVSAMVGSFLWIMKTVIFIAVSSAFLKYKFYERLRDSIFAEFIIQQLSTRESKNKGYHSFNAMFPHTRDESRDKSVTVDAKLSKMSIRKISYMEVRRLVEIVEKGILSTSFTQATNPYSHHINFKEEAIEAAHHIFTHVSRNPDSTYLTSEDFKIFLKDADDAAEAFYSMVGVWPKDEAEHDPENPLVVTLENMMTWMVRVYLERQLLSLSLTDNRKSLKELHTLMKWFTASLVIVISIYITGYDSLRSFALMIAVLAFFQFVYADFCKQVFQCLIFLFKYHMFDVGDICKVDGVKLHVENINLLKTVFLMKSGDNVGEEENAIVVYPNDELLKKLIINYTRVPSVH